jgi:predicted nucleotidyltransferase
MDTIGPMSERIDFPTLLHREATETIVRYCQTVSSVDAVLMVNSLARGQGTAQSDLDMVVLVPAAVLARERVELEAEWAAFRHNDPTLQRFHQSGAFAHVHLDFVNGVYTSEVWDEGGGPDAFEIEVGNHVVYSAPLWEATSAFAELKARWLPYYEEPLRQNRLHMVAAACRYDLDHVPFFVGRGLHFQAFDRLYKAFQEFLQALFIAHRVYPIAYNKWIHEQVAVRLGLPELYAQLPRVLEVSRLEGDAILGNADHLRGLLEEWIR